MPKGMFNREARAGPLRKPHPPDGDPATRVIDPKLGVTLVTSCWHARDTRMFPSRSTATKVGHPKPVARVEME